MEARWQDGRLETLSFSSPKESSSDSCFSQKVQKHLAGTPQDFSAVDLHLVNVSSFAQAVYRSARSIPLGQTTSYGELADSLGKPGAARAVGTALGRNPTLLVVPCHRVLSSNGQLGGFSAPGGVQTKEMMLAAEGFGVESLWSPGEMDKGLAHLMKCPRLGPVIEQVGPCRLEPSFPNYPFASIARSVLYQQLAGSAAAAIEERVRALGSEPFPSASELLEMPQESLRQAGVSRPKIATLKRLAKAVTEGRLQPERFASMPNSAVVAQVSSVKGLGRWTARMVLLSHLGRRDIFPVTDLGIRKAVQRLFGTRDLPSPTYMERKSKPWRGYRSLASWYLWRSLEL